MNILTVPFVSQITPGALEHNNDCGAASTLMVLRAYKLGPNLTVDQVYNAIQPSGDVGLSAGGMQTLLASYNIKNKWLVDMQVHDLFDPLVEGRPAIALIHYAPLVKAGLTEKIGFLGAHFVVVIGVDIKSVCINDPYTTGSGTGKDIPIAVFRDAWAQCGQDAGNPNGGAIIMDPPIRDMSIPALVPVGVKYNLVVNGINVRTIPGGTASDTFVRTIWRSVTPFVYIITITGNWGKLADGTGWVFVGTSPLLLVKA